MRVTKERITHLAGALLAKLQEEQVLDLAGGKSQALEALGKAITMELSVEDRVNAEVRQLLQAYQTDIEQGRVDEQKMFTMIKSKFIKDRGLIL